MTEADAGLIRGTFQGRLCVDGANTRAIYILTGDDATDALILDAARAKEARPDAKPPKPRTVP